MSFRYEWEDFYTDSMNNEDLIDYIAINSKQKKYILYKDHDDLITESVDQDGNYDESMYVSRTVFEFILSGVKEKNFTQLVQRDDL